MREIDLGISGLPSIAFALLARCVEKGIITKDGAAELWASDEVKP